MSKDELRIKLREEGLELLATLTLRDVYQERGVASADDSGTAGSAEGRR